MRGHIFLDEPMQRSGAGYQQSARRDQGHDRAAKGGNPIRLPDGVAGIKPGPRETFSEAA